MADRLEESLLYNALNDFEQAFIEARDMLFLTTVDAQGHASCSYRGGDPGFAPKSDGVAPVPAWKTGAWVADDLPADDPARDSWCEVV